MLDLTLTAAPALGGYDKRFGDTRLVEMANLPLTSIALPLGMSLNMAQAVKDAFGLDWPDVGRATQSGDATLAMLSPDQALLIGPEVALHDTPLANHGYLTDQTDVWVALDLEGPGRFAAMERLCPVDLAPGHFGTGHFARTVMEHMGAVVLWRDADAFRLLSARSSAGSFLHAVETSLNYTR
ncbi:MAG: sarcosine oxidase subunit gamma [Pseudomonadota bacterium]